MNADDSLCCRCRLIVRLIYGLLIDKVILPSSGELFGAVAEARWVHGVHFQIGRRECTTLGGRVRNLPHYRIEYYSNLKLTGNSALIMWSRKLSSYFSRHHIFGSPLPSRTAPHRAATDRNCPIINLQPRAKKTDHSNWGRPTLTRFRLPTVCNNVVRGMPRYLWRAG